MEELRKIKKLYGEKMSHFCRENFPTILENEGVLLDILTKNFHPSRMIYDDLLLLSQKEENKDIITRFKTYILNKFDRFEISISSTKSPKELLLEAGYDLYECKTNEEVQKFKKYYAPGEALCTFNSDRTERCHVFFAVKKNAHELNRSYFTNPKRQDEYGTSVISIQFTKDSACILSIKNRYNHTVESCDATFSNDLDSIIPGLTDSFEKEYGLVQQFRHGQFEIPNYVKANDGKFYKYHVEIGNVYYCEDNIIIDNFKVKKFDKSQYLLMDYFLLDLVNKKIELYDNYISESFHTLTDNIVRIEIIKDEKDKIVKLTHNDGTYTNITLKGSGYIYGLESNHYEKIPKKFLNVSYNIKKINLYNTISIEDFFLYYTNEIEELCCPDLREIGNRCLSNAVKVENIKLPKVKKIGNDFCKGNDQADYLDIPEVEIIGNSFFAENTMINSLNLPKVKTIGNLFFYRNDSLKDINMPEVLIVGNSFFQYGLGIETVNMPKILKVGDSFLQTTKMKHIELNSLVEVGSRFMANNEELESFSFNSLEKIGNAFLLENKRIVNVSLPKAYYIGPFFISRNSIIENVDIPNATVIDEFFLSNNKKIKYLNIPLVEEVANQFLQNVEFIDEAKLPQYLYGGNLKSLVEWIEAKELIYDSNGYYRSMTYKEYHNVHYKKGR